MTTGSRFCAFCGILVLLVAGIYYHHPSERFLGQTDVSSYLYSALALARGEGFGPRQPLLDTMPAPVRDCVVKTRFPLGLRDASPTLRQRPFYLEWEVNENNPGNLVPRFPPGYPVLLSLGYRLAGWNGLLAVNGALMLLAGMLVMYLAGKWAGPVAGLFAAVLWALFPLNVWIANTTLAEPLVLLLGLAAMAAWAKSQGSKNIFWRVLIGISVGIAPAVKLDAIPWLILPFAFAWENRREGIWRALQPVMAAVPCLIGSAAVLLGAQSGYTMESVGAMLRQPVVWVALGVAVTSFGAACFLAWRFRVFSETDRNGEQKPAVAESARFGHWLKPTGLVTLTAGLIYLFFIRPLSAGADQIYWDPWGKVVPSLREVSLPRLGWYLPPLALWVGMVSAGIAALWSKEAWMRAFAMVGIAVLLFLSYDCVNFPVQPFAGRRFMPQVVPVLIVGLAGAGVWLHERVKSRVWSGIIVGSVVLYAAAHGLMVNAKMNSRSDAAGLFDKMRELSEKVGPKGLVVLRQSSVFGDIAPLLAFGFHCDVLPVRMRDRQEMQAVEQYLRRQEMSGRTIWLWTGGDGDQMGFRGRPDGPPILQDFTMLFMHVTTKEPPFTWDDRSLKYSLRKIRFMGGVGGMPGSNYPHNLPAKPAPPDHAP